MDKQCDKLVRRHHKTFAFVPKAFPKLTNTLKKAKKTLNTQATLSDRSPIPTPQCMAGAAPQKNFCKATNHTAPTTRIHRPNYPTTAYQRRRTSTRRTNHRSNNNKPKQRRRHVHKSHPRTVDTHYKRGIARKHKSRKP